MILFPAIQLLLDPVYSESYNFDDFVQNSSSSSRPFVEILMHQEKIYSDEEIVSIKRFLDNPQFILINECPIRFSKFQESLKNFGYLNSSGMGSLHFLDAEKVINYLG